MAEYSVFRHIRDLQTQAFEADEDYKSIYDTMYQHICRTLPDLIKENPFRTQLIVAFKDEFPEGTIFKFSPIRFIFQLLVRKFENDAHLTFFFKSIKRTITKEMKGDHLVDIKVDDVYDLNALKINIQLLPVVKTDGKVKVTEITKQLSIDQ